MSACSSLYVHIPFCDTICSYCDFCKMIYSQDMVDRYLQALEQEIKTNYRGEILKTIYIGGGTPSCLNISQLKRLFSILSILKKEKTCEFTIECNPDLTEEKIKLFTEYGINRVSIGIQTIHPDYLSFLNRKHTKKQIIQLIKHLKENGISNINVDLMYAFPKQTIEELQKDLDFFLSLQVPHISTYSLMIEPHTVLDIQHVKPIDEDLDALMYETIKNTLQKHQYIHYETSNYAKEGFESKHNLTYWNNHRYYGFGLGASGYIDDIRYTNTRSLQSYINGSYRLEENSLSEQETLENAFMLGFRKTKGISITEFQEKYNVDVLQFDVVKKLLKDGKLMKDGDYLSIKEEYLYISNTILVDFIDMF